jgi:hypothetical protein
VRGRSVSRSLGGCPLRKSQLGLGRTRSQVGCVERRLWVGERMVQVNVDLANVALHTGLVEITDETIPVLIRVCQKRRHMNVRSLPMCEGTRTCPRTYIRPMGGPL